MKRFFLASVFVVVPCLAVAADLKTPPSAYKAPPAPVYDQWTGFYVGINGGYGFDLSGVQAFAPVPLADLAASPQGFVGGIQAGYNWHFNPFVFGIEADIDGTNLTGTASMPGIITAESKNSFLASVRGRFGFAIGNNALLYGTAGWGWGGGSFSVTDLTTGASSTVSPTLNGVTWGGGVEFPFTPNLVGRVEYLQYDFGNMSNTMEGVTFTTRDRVDAIRGGLSYKF